MSLKSFRDRNPYLIGLVSVGLIGALVAAAFAVGIFHLGEDAYPVRGIFADAGGIQSGDDVRVAGVKVGRVTGVEADRRQGRVFVDFLVDDGVDLGPETTAEVALQTLLGTKFLRLDGPVEGPFLASVPEDERVIPLERTKTPFDVFELARIGTRSIEATDTAKLNQFIVQLADITEGKKAQIHELLEGLNKTATAVGSRDVQLRDLLEQADKLSATLAEKDQTLVALLDHSQAILDMVARRRADIARGIENTNIAVGQLAGILGAHKTELDAILDTLHPTLDLLDRRQADLDRTLAYLGPGSIGLAKAASHGPWADVYVRTIGPNLIGLLQQLQGSQP